MWGQLKTLHPVFPRAGDIAAPWSCPAHGAGWHQTPNPGLWGKWGNPGLVGTGASSPLLPPAGARAWTFAMPPAMPPCNTPSNVPCNAPFCAPALLLHSTFPPVLLPSPSSSSHIKPYTSFPLPRPSGALEETVKTLANPALSNPREAWEGEEGQGS